MRKIFYKFSFALVIAAVLLLVLDLTGIFAPAKGLAAAIASPFQKAAYSAGQGLSDMISPWFARNNLEEENKILKFRVEGLALENAELRALQGENETLRDQLEFSKRSDYDFAVADVIGWETGLAGRRVLVVNRGEDDGIRVGYPVAVAPDENTGESEGGFIVGKVAEAGRRLSKILLLTDERSSVAAAIAKEEGSAGIVSGRGKGTAMHMDLIPADREIEVGDLVVTSGIEDHVPAGFVIGEVKEVSLKSGDFFHQADILPLVSFDKLRIISVIVPRADDSPREPDNQE